MTEHTDRQALEDLYSWPVPDVGRPPERPSWYRQAARAVWRFVWVDLWRAPLEPYPDDSAVLRRIRIHEWATGGARRLRKLDREEAREILRVTGMLLGFAKGHWE